MRVGVCRAEEKEVNYQGGALQYDCHSTQLWTLSNRPFWIRIFKDSETFCMNFRMFIAHTYEFCRFEDARLLQFLQFWMRCKQGYPATRIRLIGEPYVRYFRWDTHQYQWNIQHHQIIMSSSSRLTRLLIFTGVCPSINLLFQYQKFLKKLLFDTQC